VSAHVTRLAEGVCGRCYTHEVYLRAEIRKGTLLTPYTGELDVFTIIKVKDEPPKS
jgi:hypothetical protein